MIGAQALVISGAQRGKIDILVSIMLAAVTNNPLDFSDFIP